MAFDESMREALVDEAVAKWIDGPEEIDAFCDWLILETVKRTQTLKCRKCGAELQPTDHEARKCPNCKVWTFKN